jgi:hypothetical protein
MTDGHAIVYRQIGYLEEGEEQSAELPVCGQCVPKNAHFARREDVPEGACTMGHASIPVETAAALVALGWTPPPRLVKVDGVLTEGDADTAREALRQMKADPHGLEQGWAVQPYTDHGSPRYVFRCWGTDDGCEGLVSLDHTTRTSAESARDRHLAEAHQPADGTPR